MQSMTPSLGWATICSEILRYPAIRWWNITNVSALNMRQSRSSLQWSYNKASGHSLREQPRTPLSPPQCAITFFFRSFLVLISYVNRCKASSMDLPLSIMESTRATRLSGVMHLVLSACEPTLRGDKRNFQCRSIRRSSFYFSMTWPNSHFPM